MQNRLTSRLTTPGAAARLPTTSSLRNPTANAVRTLATPSFKGSAPTTAATTAQASLQNPANLAKVLDDVNSRDFALLTEIMMSLLLNAIQIYTSQHSLQNQLVITPNERSRLKEMVDIFTFAKWMNIVQSVIDSLSAQPQLFWTNLQLRLQQSENTQAHGYYFLPLTDIQGLYRFLERAAPNHYSLLLSQLPTIQQLTTFHHPLYKASSQHRSDFPRELPPSLQQQPTVNTFTDQQGSTLATNSSKPTTGGLEIDFGASPIPQRRIESRHNAHRYDPTTPSYSSAASHNNEQSQSGNDIVPPITPTRQSFYPQQQQQQQQQQLAPQPQSFIRTPGRPRGAATPGRISLRQPYHETQPLNITQLPPPQPLPTSSSSIIPPSTHPATADTVISNGLEPLPLPTVPYDEEFPTTPGPTHQQPQYHTNPHLHDAEPNYSPPSTTATAPSNFLQSPLRRRHNYLNTTANTDLYDNDTTANGAHFFQTSFGHTPLGSSQANKHPSFNQSSVQYQHATNGTMVTVYGYQITDQDKVLEHLATFGQIRRVQSVQPIQHNHPNPHFNVQNDSKFGRCVVEFDTNTSANLCLSKRCNINGFLIAVIPYSPDHVRSYQPVDPHPFARRAEDKQSLLERYDLTISAKHNNMSPNLAQKPKQHVMQNIFDANLDKLEQQQRGLSTPDLIKYSATILIIFFFIIRVFIGK